MVKLSSYTFRFFFHTICDLREILFHLLILFIYLFFFDKNFLIISLFYRGLIAFLTGIDHPLEMYCTLHQNKKRKNMKFDKKIIKNSYSGLFPKQYFPTFRLLLKVSLNLLKTSLAAITL